MQATKSIVNLCIIQGSLIHGIIFDIVLYWAGNEHYGTSHLRSLRPRSLSRCHMSGNSIDVLETSPFLDQLQEVSQNHRWTWTTKEMLIISFVPRALQLYFICIDEQPAVLLRAVGHCGWAALWALLIDRGWQPKLQLALTVSWRMKWDHCLLFTWWLCKDQSSCLW